MRQMTCGRNDRKTGCPKDSRRESAVYDCYTEYNVVGLETIATTAAQQKNPDDGIAAAAISVSESAETTVAIAATAAQKQKDNDPTASSFI